MVVVEGKTDTLNFPKKRKEPGMYSTFLMLFLYRNSICSAFSLPSRTLRNRWSSAISSVSNCDNEIGGDGKRSSPSKLNILSLGLGELEDVMNSWNQPKYRAKQIWNFVSEQGVRDFSSMTNIPKSLRDTLSQHFCIGSLKVAVEQKSRDGTVKRAYELPDGQLVESVLMPYSDGRRTACISSQAGCGMGCTFCATGQMGFVRNLTSTEIFEQARTFAAELKSLPSGSERLSNVVMMGMGEPLANYDNVLEACIRINKELGIGARHITISTVGIAPKIRQLAKEPHQFTLAVSLHEATDIARSSIMPVNKRFPISELMDACSEYITSTGRRISFEWALIAGKNDSPEVANCLGSLLRPLKGKCHVNIIPLNPTSGFDGKAGNSRALANFITVLDKKHGIPASARVRRGIDIDAGCGQLTQKKLRRQRKLAAPQQNEEIRQ